MYTIKNIIFGLFFVMILIQAVFAQDDNNFNNHHNDHPNNNHETHDNNNNHNNFNNHHDDHHDDHHNDDHHDNDHHNDHHDDHHNDNHHDNDHHDDHHNDNHHDNDHHDNHNHKKVLGVRDDNDHFHPPQNRACRGFQRCVPGDNQWYIECVHSKSNYHRCPGGSICHQQGDRIRCGRK
ncbi:hypothetical protein BB559_004189 [Furculomyces boomerangus]|uniref:Chitin-binding type-2 domain-containing protein n=2 Tax=Harpellales TaxID=61421 RepID=A0A2T9YG48_9FUNG|nr:hypothetical protein BB559_005553 [Furculomyces boomerangus]PVU91322.1 hypothetical protein BB559_004189 [Furculomyces boomerangus]PWA03305.1 hypothetical protein BB558_000531 [Smittium angustum]